MPGGLGRGKDLEEKPLQSFAAALLLLCFKI